MTDKLEREELLDELEQAFSCKLADAWQYPSRKPEIKQALQQIKALIQKPEVTEEWIDKKAKELSKLSAYSDGQGVTYFKDTKIFKNLIRSLVEEIRK